MLPTCSCLMQLAITGRHDCAWAWVSGMRGAHIEDGSAAVFWGLTANVRIICYCQQALAALAVTWIWGRRCPLAERVYTRDQCATMEKVSFLIFPFLLSQFREQWTDLCVRHRTESTLNRNARWYSYISQSYVLTLLDRPRCWCGSYLPLVEFTARTTHTHSRAEPVHPHTQEFRPHWVATSVYTWTCLYWVLSRVTTILIIYSHWDSDI